MATYTFFTNPMSRGQITRWALHEAGADYRTELVGWQNKPDALIQANPMGKVPTLVHHHDGDHVHIVTEAAAICHYLAEMEAPELLPKEHEKADYFRWLFFAAGPVEQAITAKSMGWEPTAKQQGMAGFGSFDRTMDTLEGHLTQNSFVCGERFTMADVYVGSQVDWGLQFGTIEPRDAFTSYAERVRSREAYTSAKAIDTSLMEEAQENG